MTTRTSTPQGTDVDTRRVDYAFPLPGDNRRWIVVTFSAPGEAEPSDQVAVDETRLPEGPQLGEFAERLSVRQMGKPARL